MKRKGMLFGAVFILVSLIIGMPGIQISAAENNWTVLLYHEPVHPVGKVTINTKGQFAWHPMELS